MMIRIYSFGASFALLYSFVGSSACCDNLPTQKPQNVATIDDLPPGGKLTIRWMGYSSSGKYFAIRYKLDAKRDIIRVWDLKTWKQVLHAKVGGAWEPELTPSVAFDPAESRLILVERTQLRIIELMAGGRSIAAKPELPAKSPELTSFISIAPAPQEQMYHLSYISIDNTLVMTNYHLSESHNNKIVFEHKPQFQDTYDIVSHATSAPAFAVSTSTALKVDDSRVTIYDTSVAKQIGSMGPLESRPTALSISNDGKRIAIGDGSGFVTTRTISQPNSERRFQVAKRMISDVAVSPEGSIVACSTLDQDSENVFLLSFNSGKAIASYSIDPRGVYSIRFHPDGKSVAVIGSDATLRVLKVNSQQ